MKKMQKILCMLLALAMLLSFAACAAKEAAPNTTVPPPAAVEAPHLPQAHLRLTPPPLLQTL